MKKLKIIVKIFLILIPIYLIFNFKFAIVEGDSMKPNLNNNDIIIYKKNVKKIKRFDIVIVKVDDFKFIKRVVGLPGEKIEFVDGKLYVNGYYVEEKFQKSITKDFNNSDIISTDVVPKDKILVLGDNRLFSSDSREFGLVDINDIEGMFIIKLFKKQ